MDFSEVLPEKSHLFCATWTAPRKITPFQCNMDAFHWLLCCCLSSFGCQLGSWWENRMKLWTGRGVQILNSHRKVGGKKSETCEVECKYSTLLSFLLDGKVKCASTCWFLSTYMTKWQVGNKEFSYFIFTKNNKMDCFHRNRQIPFISAK